MGIKKILKFMPFFLIICNLSQGSQSEQNPKAVRILKITEAPSEIFVPPKLWDLLDGQAKDKTSQDSPKSKGHGDEQQPEDSKAKEGGFDITKDSQIFLFSPVNVDLQEKNEGVLNEPHYQIQYPRGGGQLDLSNYMGPTNGTFFISFELPNWPETMDFKVFFLSRSKKRKIDGEIFGAGCNEIINITSLVTQGTKKGGIKVNTTNDRHLAVLGGSFFFVARKNKEVFLSQITITDSSKKKLFCREN